MLKNFIHSFILFIFCVSTSSSSDMDHAIVVMTETTDWTMYQQMGEKIDVVQDLGYGEYSHIYIKIYEMGPCIYECVGNGVKHTVNPGVYEHDHEAFKGEGYISFVAPYFDKINQYRLVKRNFWGSINSLFKRMTDAQTVYDARPGYDTIVKLLLYTMFSLVRKGDRAYVFETKNIQESLLLFLEEHKNTLPDTLYAGIFGWSSYIKIDLKDHK